MLLLANCAVCFLLQLSTPSSCKYPQFVYFHQKNFKIYLGTESVDLNITLGLFTYSLNSVRLLTQ